MKDVVVRKLVELNRGFYERFAAPFSDSRSFPQPGYERLLQYIPPGAPAILDVGCGNGRFGRYLIERAISADYTGVDFSEQLLTSTSDVPGRFAVRDLSRPDCLSGLGKFDFVLSLSTLQHIPGLANRERLLREMRDHLHPGCYLALANWQFLSSSRQRRKIRPWSTIGLAASEVEQGDYLLSWERGGEGLRYVAYLDADVMGKLAKATGLRIVSSYYSDGREGSLNLYIILSG
jgi:SAM-dependent methyltransferase